MKAVAAILALGGIVVLILSIIDAAKSEYRARMALMKAKELADDSQTP